MSLVIIETFVLFAFAAIGFILTRFHVIKSEHSTVLSKILVYVFYPANNLKALSQSCTIEYIKTHYVILLSSILILTAIIFLMHFLAKLFTKDKYERFIDEYSLIIPNFGAIGYVLAERIGGTIGLTNAIIFAIPLTIYTYTFGACKLSGVKFTLKNLINPSTISLVVGIIMGITGLGSVKIINDVLIQGIFVKASYCMAPLAMLLIGIVVADFGFVTMLKNPRSYIITFLRLIVIPMAIGGILKLLSASESVIIPAVLLFSMPCGMNTIVYPKTVGQNCLPGASLSLISNLLACVTIPLVLYIFGIAI